MPDTGPIPECMTSFTCLCQEVVGRKFVAIDLRARHPFGRPNELQFDPHRDVLPGRLTSAHCKATFNLEFALRAHFKHASYLIILCQLAYDLHFGPSISQPPEIVSLVDLIHP